METETACQVYTKMYSSQLRHESTDPDGNYDSTAYFLPNEELYVWPTRSQVCAYGIRATPFEDELESDKGKQRGRTGSYNIEFEGVLRARLAWRAGDSLHNRSCRFCDLRILHHRQQLHRLRPRPRTPSPRRPQTSLSKSNTHAPCIAESSGTTRLVKGGFVPL